MLLNRNAPVGQQIRLQHSSLVADRHLASLGGDLLPLPNPSALFGAALLGRLVGVCHQSGCAVALPGLIDRPLGNRARLIDGSVARQLV